MRFAYDVVRRGGIDAVYGTDSLEQLQEAGWEAEEDPLEAAETALEATWPRVEAWINNKDTHSEEWIEKLDPVDLDALDWLIKKLDEKARKNPASIDNKTKALRAEVGILRFCKAGEEYGSVEVGRYLRIMRLRAHARAGNIPRSEVSNRKLAPLVGVSRPTLAEWDRRAKELGVSPEDWDDRRLMEIVKPRGRSPP